jgi:ABC-2 type transport system permease protein
MLVQRDLQKQYTKFRLGYLWTIIEPLGMSMVLWFVFTMLLGPRKLGLQPYLLFLSIAILPWWWFTKGISQSAQVFQKNKNQLRISTLPTELWVLRVLIVTMMEFIGLAMLITRTYPGPLIILYPVGVVVQFLLMYGLALTISSCAVVVPDLARIVRIAMRAMFYLTPVLYAMSNIPERIRPFAALNPVVAPIGLYRIGFWPQEHESALHYAISFGLCGGILILGVFVFRRLEPRILKEA